MAAAEPSVREFERALVRFNAHVLGLTAAVVASTGLFLATLVLVLRGGENVGSMLGLLAVFFPGYSVTVGGAFVGARWAAAIYNAGGALFARAYGPWLLRHVQRTREVAPAPPFARLSPLPVAVAGGATLAVALFAAHQWIALRADAPGDPLQYLALLANYLPGYTTSFAGSLLGAFWAFVYSFLAAGCVARLYNFVAARRHRGSS